VNPALRICLVSQEYPPETARGGIGSQTWNKARALADLGHTVHVLSSSADPGPDLRTQVEDGITVHRLQPPGFEFPVYEAPAFWHGYSWAVLRALRRLEEPDRYDLIDFAEYAAEGFAYQTDRTPWNWTPVVVQLHGPLAMFAERIGWPERDSDLYRVGTFMEDYSIRHADALMACSANIADFTGEFHGVPREAIDVVHCGVDAERFQPAVQAEPNGRPTVLFVGNIAANKGLTATFEAVMRLRARHPDVRLQIIGRGDDDLLRELEHRAHQAGAAHNFEFHGFVADRDRLPAFYREADVFCSPADHEVGVANVYIEAMAAGCPVVAADTGGAPEAVIDRETGLLVRPADPSSVAGALDELLSDDALREHLGNAARRRAEEYFAMDRYIERVLATYERAFAASEARRTTDTGSRGYS
jgi:glycosyltransferase involved in cell wall biosynthesis